MQLAPACPIKVMQPFGCSTVSSLCPTVLSVVSFVSDFASHCLLKPFAFAAPIRGKFCPRAMCQNLKALATPFAIDNGR